MAWENEAERIAGAFVDARRRAQPLACYPGLAPDELSKAYAIQDAAISLSSDSVAGWKVGRINQPWLARLGVDRLAGPIFAENVQAAAAGVTPQGRIFAGGFGAVEAEFVFRIGRSPQPGKTAFSCEEAAALVDAVFCGFEIASSPFAGINALGPLITISDFGNNNGLLIGPQIMDWRGSGFADWLVTTRIDGEEAGSGRVSSFPGGPIESVRFLIENIASRGFPIRPGLLVSTGAITGVHEASTGQVAEAQFGDFFTMRCTIGQA